MLRRNAAWGLCLVPLRSQQRGGYLVRRSQGGATAGYPSRSRNFLYPVNLYFIEAGGGPELCISLFSPLVRYSTSANIWSSVRLGNPGILPFPFLIVVAICEAGIRSATPSRAGNAGGDPANLSPWQTPHWL